MEDSYIEIEARIRHAQEQRTKAMGEILATSWTRCKELLQGLQSPRAQSNAVLTNGTSPFVYQFLP
jgi:hypothetical protein